MNQKLSNLFEFLYEKSGYDFRGYSPVSLARRVSLFNDRYKFNDIEQLQNALLAQKGLLRSFLNNMTVQVTEMFRDPEFYLSIRNQVIDLLRTYPRIRIWHAGCSNGAEVYSMAILLDEAGLLDRARIYATDINEDSLKQAYRGVYSLKDMQLYTKNYQEAGGTKDFADYYRTDNHSVIMDSRLKKNITFSFHNLATDWVFTEAHFIICRNVLIYFNRDLQNRVLEMFDKGLVRQGFFALGTKESIQFSTIANKFETVAKAERIYRKIG